MIDTMGTSTTNKGKATPAQTFIKFAEVKCSASDLLTTVTPWVEDGIHDYDAQIDPEGWSIAKSDIDYLNSLKTRLRGAQTLTKATNVLHAAIERWGTWFYSSSSERVEEITEYKRVLANSKGDTK